ncbi:polyphosphate glucokinase [Terrimicrobium sacchariphilum]|uniref:Polyphosphate glucokinase n=2 Tax=Terrimicrobium sacchariphilum TaxID=690879 RepID=A0A146G906_TERSA|nr:polyphosphate glucokinase [Terrimicrobium sacchariphilum]
MLDIGGSNVKCMNSRRGEMRMVKSGRRMGPEEMVAEVDSETKGWDFDVVSIGYPSLVRDGAPAREPLNLGDGWLDFDFERAFGRPVRMINDAAMQALGNYTQGRLLFLGFGTSIGACIIADDVVVPIEIGLIKIWADENLVDRVSKKALKKHGLGPWVRAVEETVELLSDVFQPDEIVLGGGNAKRIRKLPPGCRLVDNTSAYVGAERLWESSDLHAVADVSTWKIVRHLTPREQAIKKEKQSPKE